MRIVTWNIRGAQGTDGTRSLERIASSLDEWNPDLACLQEVHRYLPGGGMTDQTSRLAEMTRMSGLFASAMRGAGCFGNAILSRWPVKAAQPMSLDNKHERKRPGLWLERRILQIAVVETPVGQITLFNTHWSLDGGDRLSSAEAVCRHVRSVDGPLLLCGDLNAAPGSPEVRLLAESGLLDAGAEDDGPTFPSDQPDARIDYVWLRGLQCEFAWTFPTIASDHRPVVADFDFRPGSARGT